MTTSLAGAAYSKSFELLSKQCGAFAGAQVVYLDIYLELLSVRLKMLFI